MTHLWLTVWTASTVLVVTGLAAPSGVGRAPDQAATAHATPYSTDSLKQALQPPAHLTPWPSTETRT